MPEQDTNGSADDSHNIRTLESRYMELLEKRIADLEARLKESENAKKDPTKDKTDKDGGSKALKRSKTELMRKTNIRFRHVKYTPDGLENAQDVSETDFSKFDTGKAKEGDDLVWTRHFDRENKYEYSEVQVVSNELQDVLKVVLERDPRMHISIDNGNNSNNDVVLTSAFEPVLHNWTALEKLANADCNEPEWDKVKDRMVRFPVNSSKDEPRSTLSIEDRLFKAKTDLNTLLSHIQSTQEVSSYFGGLNTSTTTKTVHFDYLWTLFPPGEVVYSTAFMNQPQLFIVKESKHDITVEETTKDGKPLKRAWYLECWGYDWDGKTFNRVPVRFKFDHYPGAKKINTLHCFPLSYRDSSWDPDNELLRKTLLDRGKAFREFCIKKAGSQMFEYNGNTIHHGSGFQRLKNGEKQGGTDAAIDFLARLWGWGPNQGTNGGSKREVRHRAGRVIVDFESYIQHAPGHKKLYGPIGNIDLMDSNDECHCGSCLSNEMLMKDQRRHYDDQDAKAEFSDEQYLICPPRVLGYHLESRTWLELDVEKLQIIPQLVSDSAFKKLQLQKPLKELIRNLVQSHTSSTGKKALMEDIVKDKGRGLVILLHGPPGVGKTLTAESVAAMAGKPLFAISTSDIGLDPADVEHNLESLFELAARWRAVLLFDEADVFLESRSSHTSDLTRNALVSVLLRVLEYYSGILILTTNRINQFDIAVQSRVNLGIKYTNLSMTQKKQIFKQFINDVPDDKIDDKEGILEWFDEDADAVEWLEPLNGRQVRNVLFSAASLAVKEGGVLRVGHVRTMAKHTAKFQGDLKAVVQLARSKAEAGQHGD